jgi:hypothetical protein
MSETDILVVTRKHAEKKEKQKTYLVQRYMQWEQTSRSLLEYTGIR